MRKPNAGRAAAWPLLVLLASAGCGQIEQESAKSRVKSVLEGLKAEGTNSQTALCSWYVGKPVCSSDDMTSGTGAFTDWAKEKGMDRRIADYTIVSAESAGGVMVVAVTIEGKPYRIRVPASERLAWAP